MKPKEGMDYLVGLGMYTVTNITTQLVDEESVEIRTKMKALKLEILEAVKAVSKYRNETFKKGEDDGVTPA